MKKIILYIVIVLIIVSLSVCGYLYYKASKAIGYSILYPDQTIGLTYISSLYSSYSKNYNNFKLFQSYKILSVSADENQSKTILYIWVLSEGYYIDNTGTPQKIVTSSLPYKLTYYQVSIHHILNNYIVDCEIANDNNSCERIFSEDAKKNFPTLDELQAMQNEIDLQAAEFYNIK